MEPLRRRRGSKRIGEKRVAAARRLLEEVSEGTLADAIAIAMTSDEDSPYLHAILDDLEAAPLVEPHEINRLVETGHMTSIAAVVRGALSPSQREALRLYANGEATSVAEVGRRMGCSTGTAAEHLARARVRLGARSTEHAVAIAIGMGILLPPIRQVVEGRFVAQSLVHPRERESDVLVRVAKGMTDREIADDLGLSIETAKNHVDDVRAIYGARNRAHLVALAFAAGTLRLASSRHRPKRDLGSGSCPEDERSSPPSSEPDEPRNGSGE